MCTLVLGRDVIAPGSVLVAANRDEDPARPSDPPAVLRESPRLVGGRDRLAGGTWLAIREARLMVAVLNRRDRGAALQTSHAARHAPGPSRRRRAPGQSRGALPPGRPSRGALPLEVAATREGFAAEFERDAGRAEVERLREVSGPGLPLDALCRAIALLGEAPFAPCSLVFAAPESSWMVGLEGGGPPRPVAIGPGWHVLTHADLDDPREPRTAWLVRGLLGFRPGSAAEAEGRLEEILRSHGDRPTGAPPVCLHESRMRTVSASLVRLGAGPAAYRHAEGRPCENPLEDRGALLPGATPRRGSTNRLSGPGATA